VFLGSLKKELDVLGEEYELKEIIVRSNCARAFVTKLLSTVFVPNALKNKLG
jgi:hypothetical protein